MKQIRKIFQYYIKTFIMSVLFIIFHPLQFKRACFLLLQWKHQIRKFKMYAIADLVSLFDYKKENSIFDFMPFSAIIVFMKNISGDCDDAAVLGYWACKQARIKGNIVRLASEDSGHLIFISKNKDLVISNNSVYTLRTDNDWRLELLALFPGKKYHIDMIVR